MKIILKIFFLLLLPGLATAQTDHNYTDSLLNALSIAPNDTIRMEINRKLGFYYQDSEPDTASVYHETQLALAQKLHLQLWEADAYEQIGYCYASDFKLSLAYENYMRGLKIAEDPSSAANGWGYANFSYSKSPDDARRSIIGMIHFELGGFYAKTLNFKEALSHDFEAEKIGESLKNQKILSLSNRDLGVYYLNIADKPDSALIYFRKALRYYQNSPYQKNLGTVYLNIGFYYLQLQNYDSAKVNFQSAIAVSTDSASLRLQGVARRSLGLLFIKSGSLDSALVYTLQGQKTVESIKDSLGMTQGYLQLASIYDEKKEYATAYNYLAKGKDIEEKLNAEYVDRLMQFQNLDFDQKIRLQQLEKESQLAKSRNRTYALLTGLGLFLLIAILLYRNNRQKQKANKVLEITLANLRSTQSQLVQSEKMASLGELTAGIAHEIQNPLNFVNNFSEVNREMIAEMKEEIAKGNYEEVKIIADDIEANQEKINHHGKRADSIVKGMLQHSRSSTGAKEPTDINALADEYLRLSYYGLRAKDKSFNAELKTDFDSSIGKINIVPQDIGRVLLNFYNNAFYAVNEKAKLSANSYQPTASVTTKKSENSVTITVKDNGGGIPDNIKEKIFQPFFTTKPTGSGTGLGLSLSYDIVKAHGGEIHVETKENEGTEFVIQLPGI